jgi:hypothetical protein
MSLHVSLFVWLPVRRTVKRHFKLLMAEGPRKKVLNVESVKADNGIEYIGLLCHDASSVREQRMTHVIARDTGVRRATQLTTRV